MRTRIALGLFLFMVAAAAGAESEEPPGAWDRLGFGVTASNFEVNSRDSTEPHLSAFSLGAIVSFRLSRYLSLDAEVFDIEDVGERTEFDELGRVGGTGAMLSGRLRLPLSEEIGAYLRLGATQLNLSDRSRFADRDFGGDLTQFAYGAGIHGRYWFVEYLNQGQQDGVYLQQLRSGIGLRF